MSRALFVPIAALLIAGSAVAQERIAPLERSIAPAPAPQVTRDPDRERLIGRWRGEAPGRDGSTVSWITERNADGSYRTDFVRTMGESARESQIEVGVWGLAGGIYFTAVRAYLHGGQLKQADTTDPDLYDAYQVNKIGDDVFEYTDLRSKRKIRVVKVAEAPAGG
jgi:hypothetical protein